MHALVAITYTFYIDEGSGKRKNTDSDDWKTRTNEWERYSINQQNVWAALIVHEQKEVLQRNDKKRYDKADWEFQKLFARDISDRKRRSVWITYRIESELSGRIQSNQIVLRDGELKI